MNNLECLNLCIIHAVVKHLYLNVICNTEDLNFDSH